VVIQAEKNPIDRSVSVIYLEINLSGEVITHRKPGCICSLPVKGGNQSVHVLILPREVITAFFGLI